MQQTGRKGIHDLVGKLIYWKLCKRLRFYFADKWYMHKQESIQDNVRHKILSDFEKQMDHQIPSRRSRLAFINKKQRNFHQVDFDVSANHKVKVKVNEGKMLHEYLDLARELKKLWNMKVTGIPIVVIYLGTVPKNLVKDGVNSR